MKRKNYMLSALFLFLLFLTPLGAEDLPKYFPDGTLDALVILPPPPEEGSPEQKAELAMTKKVSDTRSKAETTIAEFQINLDFFTFASVIGPWFKKESFPETYKIFKRVEFQTKSVTNSGKNFWKKRRPYDADPSIKALKKEKSLTYPSGHSSRGMVYATVLAEVFPEKKEELLKYGRNIGWNRIIAGVHYTSDVHNGRVLGMAIARELIKSPGFKKDLEVMKAEVKAAQR